MQHERTTMPSPEEREQGPNSFQKTRDIASDMLKENLENTVEPSVANLAGGDPDISPIQPEGVTGDDQEGKNTDAVEGENAGTDNSDSGAAETTETNALNEASQEKAAEPEAARSKSAKKK